MKLLLSNFLFLISIYCSFAGDKAPFKSQSFDWGKAKVEKTKTGDQRHFITGYTNHLDYLEIHATTLDPGKGAPEKDIRLKYEKLLILKEGQVIQTINCAKKILTPGSVVLASADELLNLQNEGAAPATYFMIQWSNTAIATPATEKQLTNSETLIWENITAIPTELGFTRKFFKEPTRYLYEFEMHATTLKQGINSHPPHTHIDDEIILIRSGLVEEVVNDTVKPLGPGSFVLLNGMDPHGIRNIGIGPCEYFAFRFLKGKPVK